VPTRDDVHAEVRQALAAVEDPELPVSIVDLGMVRGVTVSAGTALVELVPTFIACPALWLVESEVKQSVTRVSAVDECEVVWLEGGWSGSDVTEAGRRALAGAGLAVPAGDGTVVCPFCGSHDPSETSPFGSAVCRTAAYCQACQTPFEVLKVKRAVGGGAQSPQADPPRANGRTPSGVAEARWRPGGGRVP